MKRDLKTLGLALGAMLALGALLAAGASAQGERFHSTYKNVILTGESSNPVLRLGNNSTIEGLKVSCEAVTLEGTVEGEFNPESETWTSKEVTLHPTHDGSCLTPVGEAPVGTSGCDYILTSEYNIQETEGEHIDEHAPVEVECTHGDTIEITGTACKIKIGGGYSEDHPTEIEAEGEVIHTQSYGDVTENTLTTGVTYTNIGKEHEKTVTVDATIDSIPFTSEGFLCGFAGIPKESHDAFYEADAVVAGFRDLSDPCLVNETTHELEECEEGEEVGIWWE